MIEENKIKNLGDIDIWCFNYRGIQVEINHFKNETKYDFLRNQLILFLFLRLNPDRRNELLTPNLQQTALRFLPR